MLHNASCIGFPKGVKLDFKLLATVAPGIATLVCLHEEITARAATSSTTLPAVFLNADLVRGPCYAPHLVGRWQKPLPATSFIEEVIEALAAARCPKDLNAALSLGWTTGL